MPSPVLRRDRNHFDRAAPIDRLQTLFGKLLLDAIGLRIGLIHLVDRQRRSARPPP